MLIFFRKLFASDVFSSWAHLGLSEPSRSSTWRPSSAPARPSSRSSSAQIQLSSAEASSTETSPILKKLEKQWAAWNCSFSLRNSLPATFFPPGRILAFLSLRGAPHGGPVQLQLGPALGPAQLRSSSAQLSPAPLRPAQFSKNWKSSGLPGIAYFLYETLCRRRFFLLGASWPF